MKKFAPLLVAAIFSTALLCLLSSCEHRRYAIVMSSHDGVLERSLTVTLTSDSNAALPAEEIAAIGKLYRKTEANADGRAVTFTGKFGGRTPNDIGGVGFHAFIESPVGSVTAYIERFRGSDDLLDQMETRTKAADRLVDLVSGWLKTQIGGEKDFDKVQAFLDKDVRRDLKNVSLYCWMMSNGLVRAESARQEPFAERFAPETASGYAGAASAPAASQPAAHGQEATPAKAREDAGVRILQYLAERGYLLPKDAGPARKAKEANRLAPPGPYGILAKLSLSDSDEKKVALATLAEQVLTEKAGVGNKAMIQKITTFWTADANAAEASLRQYLRQTDEYKKTLAAWKAEPNKEPNAPEPDSMEVLSSLALSCIDFGSVGPDDNDELVIALACPVAPLYTNGVYGAAGEDPNFLYWSRIIQKAAPRYHCLPTICYAVWAAPNEAFQQKHFGGAVLTGDRLMEYCLWRQGLSAKEAGEWDAMIATLTPSPKLVEMVNSFQFSTRPKTPTTIPSGQTQPGEPAPDLSQRGKDLILNALQGSPATQPATSPAAAKPTADPAGGVVAFRVTRPSDHLGHDTVSGAMPDGTTVNYHRHWYDGCRGTLVGSDESFVIYSDNNAIAQTKFSFEEGKTYSLTYRGEMGARIMSYHGKCIEIGQILKLQLIQK